MTTEVEDAFAGAFRDYVTDGVPLSGVHKPVKSEIRAIGPLIQARLNASVMRYAGDWAVFLITGQSNAIGANTDGGGDLTLNPNVFVYRVSTGTIEIADPTKSPFLGSNNNAGWQAAKHYQERHGGNVLIIVVAQGSVPLDEWLVGGFMWDYILDYVPTALALIGQTYVDRVLFSQGEGDQGVGSIVHMRKLETVLNQMRGQSWWLSGHTYIIASEFVQARTNSSQGQGLALRLLGEKTSDFVVVSSFDIPSDAVQPVHFSGVGYDQLGLRFCEMAELPYGGHARPVRPRFSPGSITFIVDPTPGDDVDFTDLFEALIFFSSIRLGFGATATVTVRGKHSPIGASVQLALSEGGQWIFQGVKAGGFVQPTKADISATAATALAYLQTQYLTEIEIANKLLILNGNNCGTWKDMLLTQTGAAGAVSGAVMSQEDGNSPTRSQARGAIRLHNVAMHRWNGTLSGAIYANRGDIVETIDCTFSHCSTAITAANGAFVEAPNAVIAQTTQGVNASYRATVNVLSATTDSAAANFYSARLGAYVDARSAENKANKQELTNGIVET